MEKKIRELDVSHTVRPPIEVSEKKFNKAEDLAPVAERLAMPEEVATARPGLARKVGVFPSALLGTWVNVNPATGGVVKIVLRMIGRKIFTVHPYGACHPTPCDWGSQRAIAYASSVGSTQPVAFSAMFPDSWKTTILTGHFEGSLLVVETFDHFTDGSDRSDLYVREIFRRE